MGLRPRIEPLLRSPGIRATVHWVSQRSLSIYLWHMVAIYTALSLELPGTGSVLGVLAWAVALTVAIMPTVGWAEDLAARRGPTLWPRQIVDLR
jgi:peptidoglycan/LPS O-acetylase OafA/YrhL